MNGPQTHLNMSGPSFNTGGQGRYEANFNMNGSALNNYQENLEISERPPQSS